MTKVEELRDKLSEKIEGWIGQICDEHCGNSQEEFDSCNKEVTDAKADIGSLISAVEEQTKETIRKVARPLLVSRGGALEICSIPAFVLAPKDVDND